MTGQNIWNPQMVTKRTCVRVPAVAHRRASRRTSVVGRFPDDAVRRPQNTWNPQHDLRHSCGSTLEAHGVPLPQIQRILGHAQITTTGVYLHSLSDAQ